MMMLMMLLMILLIVKMQWFPWRATNLFFAEIVLTPQFRALSKYECNVVPRAPVPL